VTSGFYLRFGVRRQSGSWHLGGWPQRNVKKDNKAPALLENRAIAKPVAS